MNPCKFARKHPNLDFTPPFCDGLCVGRPSTQNTRPVAGCLQEFPSPSATGARDICSAPRMGVKLPPWQNCMYDWRMATVVGSRVTPNLVQKLLTRVTFGIISFVSFQKLHPANITYLSHETMHFVTKVVVSNRHFSGGRWEECFPYQSLRIIGPFNGEVSELVFRWGPQNKRNIYLHISPCSCGHFSPNDL